MLKNVDTFKNNEVHASDGMIGIIRDLYFDTQDLILKFMVIDTQSWLENREILISPESVKRFNWDRNKFDLGLLKRRIEQSRVISIDEPAGPGGRKQSREYYFLSTYWDSERAGGNLAHLLKDSELKRFDICLSDGRIGGTAGIIIEESTWKVEFIIVDADSMEAGKLVPLPAGWINRIDPKEGIIHVDLNKEDILNAPTFPAEELEDESNEKALYNYYSRHLY
jgi:hypothetical protein